MIDSIIAMEEKFDDGDPMIEFLFQNKYVRIRHTMYYESSVLLSILDCLRNRNDFEDGSWNDIFNEDCYMDMGFRIKWNNTKDSVNIAVRICNVEPGGTFKSQSL